LAYDCYPNNEHVSDSEFGSSAVEDNVRATESRSKAAAIIEISKQLARTTADRGISIARHDLIIFPLQNAEAAFAGACAINIVAAAALPELLELLNAAAAMGIEGAVDCRTELGSNWAKECGGALLHMPQPGSIYK
jgi:indole-3-glycerol phosphate synthase